MYALVLTAIVLLSIIEFCLETQPGFYIEFKQNASRCPWDGSAYQMDHVAPVTWVTFLIVAATST